MSSGFALIAGSIGNFLATLSHIASDAILHENQVGLTRGSGIVCKVQAIAYAIPVTATLVFNSVALPDLIEPYLKIESINQIEQVVPVNDVPTSTLTAPIIQ